MQVFKEQSESTLYQIFIDDDGHDKKRLIKIEQYYNFGSKTVLMCAVDYDEHQSPMSVYYDHKGCGKGTRYFVQDYGVEYLNSTVITFGIHQIEQNIHKHTQ